MNQSTTGPCLVCGEETTSRCEACRQAGIDLFFCSREHQKLLWSVHKKVCGPGKANPFVWPDLSQEEADEAKKHLCTHIPEKAGRSTSLYAELKMLNWDHGHKDMLELLDELVEGRSCSLTLEEKDVTLLSVRAKEYDRLDAAGLWRPETIEGVLRNASMMVKGSLGLPRPSGAWMTPLATSSFSSPLLAVLLGSPTRTTSVDR